ncbi:MAG: hypothetical protein MZU95_00120 [Desulfomicrobium escambiense]|nr:hypothetical protein [Desulfomicrobium escambiense]
MGDLSRLEEVFLNLFINAVDAMEGKGTIKVSSRLSSTGMVKIYISRYGKGH